MVSQHLPHTKCEGNRQWMKFLRRQFLQYCANPQLALSLSQTDLPIRKARPGIEGSAQDDFIFNRAIPPKFCMRHTPHLSTPRFPSEPLEVPAILRTRMPFRTSISSDWILRRPFPAAPLLLSDRRYNPGSKAIKRRSKRCLLGATAPRGFFFRGNRSRMSPYGWRWTGVVPEAGVSWSVSSRRR